MTPVLLDTQIVLWAGNAPDRLSDEIRSWLLDPAQPVLVSSVSIAELAIKISIGKLSMPVEPTQWCQQLNFTLVDLTSDEANNVSRLPLIHRDPFDRLLIAQAFANDWTLVSTDETVLAYPTVKLRRAN